MTNLVISEAYMSADKLKTECLLRLKDIIGDSRAVPPIHPIIPVSRSTWWAGVKSGRYPRPVKLGPRVAAWRAEDIRELINQQFHDEMEIGAESRRGR